MSGSLYHPLLKYSVAVDLMKAWKTLPKLLKFSYTRGIKVAPMMFAASWYFFVFAFSRCVENDPLVSMLSEMHCLADGFGCVK